MKVVASLGSLLLAAALLFGSNGMHSTLLGVRGTIEGFAGAEIALLMTAYFGGFILGCRFVPRFIRQVGHIRVFTALASVASAAAISHALFVESWFWIITRIATGFCFAGLQMIIESWINDRATNENRGQVLSVYRIVDFTSATFFQALLPVFNPESFVPFGVLTILISFALVPVALTRIEAPKVPKSAKLDLKRLWTVSPLAAAGAALIGLSASSYWAMGPIFVSGLGYPAETTGLFVGALIFGGALAQWPLGWVSDKTDRRYVIIGLASLAVVLAFLVPTIAAVSQTTLILAGLMFGAVSVPSFGLTIAHANDHAEPGTSVAVNGGLLLLYGSAATIGPIVASQLMGLFGSNFLYYWIAIIHIALVVFGLLRLRQRAAPETREDYVPVLRTQPGMFELDPRRDPEEDRPDIPQPEDAVAGERV
ncbi:MFS transporter [Parvularcula sp. ZS-1/3]|uniref:MFS transporter n=1 Tax=Parvularcula mediterranea TaxID=2732508 RepID=A0A7Y3RKD4_9PROT|nr:MFS transporter [Parvularcula mediterranea]NNU15161.1 MFS transporter [Parvularcula mediterranea]